jgi:enolase-phosphatase E1
MPIQAIVTDIEGTTTSLAFVQDVLFPYAAQALPSFVREHQSEPAVAQALAAVRDQMQAPNASLDAVIEQLLQWIDTDQKVTPLKAIQGLIWEDGYGSGAYQGHVYADAEAALRSWWEAGMGLYVYSSGSIWAQKLLYAHTAFGDLTPWFRGYFDTTSGPKRDRASYERIQQAIGHPAETLLFLSDIPAELDAAKAAGWGTCGLARPGDTSLTALDRAESPHPWVAGFAEIKLEPLP